MVVRPDTFELLGYGNGVPMGRHIYVNHFPQSTKNPYQSLMAAGCRLHGALPFGITDGLRGLVRAVCASKGDILHLHWIDGPIGTHGLLGSIVRLGVFHASMVMWRLRGRRIVWTVHNLVNHERKRPWVDRAHGCLVGLEARWVLVHGLSVVPLVARTFLVKQEKIRVIPHGNYDGIVKPHPHRQRGSSAVRFLFFGAVRPYKGVVELIETFARLQGPHELRIIGAPNQHGLRREIERSARFDARIQVTLDFIADQELERLLAWCDVVVLPYRSVFTSGSLLMAMTAGRPVIAPRVGLIPQYIDEGAAFLYHPDEPGGLLSALERATECAILDRMAERSRELASWYDWERIGRELVRLYLE